MDELKHLIDDELTRPSSPVAPKERLRKRPSIHSYAREAGALISKAASTATKIADRVDHARVARNKQDSFNNFELAVGGRDALIATLHYSPKDSHAKVALNKLFTDPEFLHLGDAMLDVICQRNKVDLATLILAFKEAKTAQLTIQAITSLSTAFPTVIEQIGQDAQNRFEPCPVCLGETRVQRIGDNGEWALDDFGMPRTQLCYNCRGTGKVFKEHDVANRKLLLELTGVLEQGNGKRQTAVQINQTFKADFAPGDGSFEHLIKAIDVQPQPALPAATEIDVPFSLYDKGASDPTSQDDPAISGGGQPAELESSNVRQDLV